jgi:dsRNA-specific ribonuclease
MEVDVDDEPENSFCFYKSSLDELAKEKCIQVPPLIITENDVAGMSVDDCTTDNYDFPNVYQILQCLTLKSACDDFDLERYEILGDCYLKLISVLKIYIDFYKTNEGKMVSLKSARVSNRNLFELAIKKELNKYVVSKKFNRKENWLAPFAKENETTSIVKLSDKSLADCVEALIGVYLVSLGTDAAKAFIQWLEFIISNQLGKTNFFDQLTLPNPNLTQQVDHVDALKEKYETFQQETLGYTFNNIFYLYQAFTHSSDVKNRCTSSYQK